ncbi:MAG: hypothetical protein WC011_00295 [Candidatus Paceibacterota bacterium]
MNTSHYDLEAQPACATIIQLKKEIRSGDFKLQDKKKKKLEVERLKKEIEPLKIKSKHPDGAGLGS